jgi:putative oxidoreductase
VVTLFVIGRIIFGSYFIFNAFNHFTHIGVMSGYAESKGVPAARLAVVVTGLLLLLGGISMLLGLYPIFGIILLLIFFIPVSFWMHAFWTTADPQRKMIERINFMKNMALIGALLMLFMIARPWPVSIIY